MLPIISSLLQVIEGMRCCLGDQMPNAIITEHNVILTVVMIREQYISFYHSTLEIERHFTSAPPKQGMNGSTEV